MAITKIQSQTAPLISFAIPTHNFGKYITETVKSIYDGTLYLNPLDIEVVILDGGSTDKTEEIISSLSKHYVNIKYKKNSHRGGIDRDLDEVAEIATGKYIWLFSADDTLSHGWDVHFKKAIMNDPEIVLVPAMLCSLNMRSIRPNPIFSVKNKKTIIEWAFDVKGTGVDNYLKSSKTLEALFGFLSAIIVKSNFWNSLSKREDYYGTCWAHCARLMPVFGRKSNINYISEIIINKRSENDSFMENGLINRISIAVDGWSRIIEEFFENESYKRILYARLRRDVSISLFLYAKITARNTAERTQLDRLAKRQYLSSCITAQSIFSYALYLVFPSNRLVLNLVNRNMAVLKKIRNKIRGIL